MGTAWGELMLRALVAVLEAIANKRVPRLKMIEVTCFNAPAPEAGVNERCKEALRSLEVKTMPLSVDLTYVRFESDPIQELGDVFVGASNESALLGVRVVTFSSQDIRRLKAHGAIACNRILKRADFRRTVVTDLKEDALGQAAGAVQSYGSAVGAAVIKPLHFVLFEGGNLLCVLANSLAPDRAAAQTRCDYLDLNRIHRIG